MKIEFEIKEEDVIVVIDGLEQAASKLTNARSFNAVQKVIQEIKEDVSNGVEIFQELKKHLAPYTDGSPILLSSNFRTQLGISNVMIESPNGLIFLLNRILKQLVGVHKPGATAVIIKKTKIDTAKKIEDLVNLILTNYEISK